MSQSSIKSLLVQIATNNLKSNEAHILKFIKERTEQGKWSIREDGSREITHFTTVLDIEEHLMAKQSTVTSRVSALEDSGVIFSKGTVTKTNGPGGEKITYSCFYFEPRPKIQEANAERRRNKKFRRVVDHLLKNYYAKLNPKTVQLLKDDLTKSKVVQGELF